MRCLKLYRCLIAVLLSIPLNALYSQWEIQETGVKSSITDLFFLDSLNGWAVTDSTIYLHTIDSGTNWIIEKFNVDNYGVNQIQFVNNEIGYACGSLGRILSTKDGGKSWMLYPNTFEIDFQDLSFVNEVEGWAVGERYGDNWGRGMIVHTSDGGITWQKQLELESTNQLDVKFFKSIRMKNTNEGWAIAGDYFDNFSLTYVYKTEDGGKNWVKLDSPIQRPARRLKVINEDTLWVDGYGVAQMSISVDGGNNWVLIENEYRYISAISPLSGNKGWACSVDIRGKDPSLIIYTSDRGVSCVEELQLDEYVLDIENKGNYVWLAGSDGLIMREKINYTAIEDIDYFPNSFESLPNYPNPFNSQTTITYILPKETDVKIEIYNSIGKIISSVSFFSQQAGKHLFVWGAKDNFGNAISTGVYFYRIITSYQDTIVQEKTSKMLLVK